MRPRYISLGPYTRWTDEKRPIEWHEKLGHPSELAVEIGCGVGDFLVRMARENPEKGFVGIELGWAMVRRTLRKIGVARVNNALVVQADARVAFERLFAEKTIDNAYALFPCPWPKKRHVKHRLFSNSFLRLVNSRLMEGGDLQIVTDHGPYFQWIASQLSDSGFEVGSHKVPPKFSTKYERKWQAMGQESFYEFLLIKRRHISVPVKEDTALKTYCVDRFEAERFQPVGNRGRVIVEFKETLYDPVRQKAMIRSLVCEESLLQDFWVEIVRMEDEWHIRPAKGCKIIPTVGLQRALDLIYEAAKN